MPVPRIAKGTTNLPHEHPERRLRHGCRRPPGTHPLRADASRAQSVRATGFIRGDSEATLSRVPLPGGERTNRFVEARALHGWRSSC